MVLPDSHGIPRAPRYSGICATEVGALSPTGLSPSLVSLSSGVQLKPDFVTPRAVCRPAPRISHYTGDATPCRVEHANRFRLFPFRSPLLRESLLFFLPPGTEMFQFPGFALQGLCIQPRSDRALPRPGCPIRKSPDLWLFAPPRSFSQLTTSFIASVCLGIHHMLLIA